MSLTYDLLVQDTISELNRDDADFVAQIPRFISTALDIISARFQTIGLNRYVTDIMQPQQPVILNPGRWRRPVSFSIGIKATPTDVGFNKYITLDLLDYEYLRDYWPNPTETAQPKFYAVYGPYNILVAPSPDLAYPFEVGYMELSAPLSSVSQTNWITNFAPSLLRFATFIQAAIWAENDKLLSIFKQSYEEVLASLVAQNESRKVDRGNTRGAGV